MFIRTAISMSEGTLPHDHGDVKDMEEFRRILSVTVGFDRVSEVPG